MDIGIIVAISAATFTIAGVVISMMFWTRSEINDVRKDLINVQREFNGIISEIKEENKEFHHRLLEIEKRKH